MRGPKAFLSVLLILGVPGLGRPLPAMAQGVVRDIVFTAGISAERYEGNLPAVALPVVDSTDRAAAAVGEFGVRGDLRLVNGEDRSLLFRFDGGIRQFAATGFELRDYAPREWVGRGELSWIVPAGDWGMLRTTLGTRLRTVQDRTPIPLFIEPGFREMNGGAELALRPRGGVHLTAGLSGEVTDYESIAFLPQLDLLDRRSLGLDVGAEWGEGRRTRVHAELRRYLYPEQGTFDPSDPYRRDLTLQVGASWLHEGPVFAEVELRGTMNRSNSSRPEYNALAARALVATPLGEELGLQLYGSLTVKRYVTPSPFARLVPGEEADNASLVYLQLSRPLAPALDGALRFGWTRAETEIGDSYFRRYGASVLLNFRPWRR